MCKMWQMATGNFLTAAATRVAFFHFPFIRSAILFFTAAKYATQKCPLITVEKPLKQKPHFFFLFVLLSKIFLHTLAEGFIPVGRKFGDPIWYIYFY